MKQRFLNAILVLLGARKAYNPKTHFISRYSTKPRARKVSAPYETLPDPLEQWQEGEQET